MTTYSPDEANSGRHASGGDGKVFSTQAIPSGTWQAYNRQTIGSRYDGGNMVMLKDICAFLKYHAAAVPSKKQLLRQMVVNHGMSSSMWPQVMQMLEQFPLSVIQFLHHHQVQVALTRELETDDAYSLRYGTTVAHYDEGANVIRVPEYCHFLFGRTERNRHFSVQVLAHEIGHAIDHWLGSDLGWQHPLRDNPVMNIAYTMDVRHLRHNVPDRMQRRKLFYFMPESTQVSEFARARTEAIAEVIGACILPGTASPQQILSAFPKLSIQIQRHLIQAKLLEVPPCQTSRT